jgi:hypothetical protein
VTSPKNTLLTPQVTSGGGLPRSKNNLAKKKGAFRANGVPAGKTVSLSRLKAC